ncbi:hypothetical protein BV898_09399 [Hypsibius exemplaris]|uniref:Uncharacterized protein n=1 Tax=Hypsibius exemplaris TaxID=2072580 RepID=A0A1W0WMI1_HYPEX|nr:hypothetical protein BV898_09399 [Hypsibius exemplaris]
MDVFCADDPQLRRFFQTATIGSSGQLVHPKFNPLPMSPNTSFYSAGGCGDCTCQTRRRTTGLPVLFEGTEGINDDGDHGQLSSSITNLPTHIYASTSTITATAGGGSSFASRCSTWDSSTKAKPKRQSQQQQQVPAPQCTCGIHNNNTGER